VRHDRHRLIAVVPRHYLDHASTSPLRPAAFAAMEPWLRDPAGDPSRIHAEGLRARVAVEEAREQVATLLGARSREVVFTSGATEAIAAACWGAAPRGSHQVLAAVEHSAVREAAHRAGAVVVVPVDRTGRVDVAALIDAIRPDTALVHVQWANHEVGTVQPIATVVEACRERGVLVHVDAAQAAGHVPIDFGALGADLVSVSAHKLGGPAGTGALLVRRGLRVPPLLVGGDQERARRAGLENVAAIVAFGAACHELTDTLPREAAEARSLTDVATAAATDLDGVEQLGDPVDRVPHLVCFGVDDVEPQAVLLGLDRAGIAAHSGSACASESLEPSPVLEAMGLDAHRSLRISVGHSTTRADIDAFAQALPRVVADLRALRSA
jgi:cysteine desulfurase